MTIGPILTAPVAVQRSEAVPDAKTEGAAKQFEALLIAQMLKSMHQNGSGWLGTGEDQSGQAAMDFAEEQFASAITAGGGLGLARVIKSGLTASTRAASQATHQKLQE